MIFSRTRDVTGEEPTNEQLISIYQNAIDNKQTDKAGIKPLQEEIRELQNLLEKKL